MGITGLLPFLKPCSRQVHMRQFKGKCVAVDTYCWLHRGAFACADKLGMGVDSDQYITYCMKYVRMLLSNGIKPILVFDGKNLPAKKDVELKRRENRVTYKQKAAQLLAEGNKAAAREAFERCIDITPDMAMSTIQAARELGVDCIVAPYEADAQLTYLCNGGFADAVISEDSDLLAFGCAKVIFKLDTSGNGVLIERSSITDHLKLNSLGGGFNKFRWMCILSGCDYFPGVPSVGLTTALSVVKKSQLDLPQLADKIFMYAKKIDRLSAEEVATVVRAEQSFLYQVVFDPRTRKQVRLTKPPLHLTEESLFFAGSINSNQEQAYKLALGNVNHQTMQERDFFNPDKGQTLAKNSSIWSLNFTPKRDSTIDVSAIQNKMFDSPIILSTKDKIVTVATKNNKKRASLPSEDSQNSLLSLKKFKSMYGEEELSETEAEVSIDNEIDEFKENISNESVDYDHVHVLASPSPKSKLSLSLEERLPLTPKSPKSSFQLFGASTTTPKSSALSPKQTKSPVLSKSKTSVISKYFSTCPYKSPVTTSSQKDKSPSPASSNKSSCFNFNLSKQNLNLPTRLSATPTSSSVNKPFKAPGMRTLSSSAPKTNFFDQWRSAKQKVIGSQDSTTNSSNTDIDIVCID